VIVCGVDDFVFILIGIGFGVGIVLYGEFYWGYYGLVGEFDYVCVGLSEDIDLCVEVLVVFVYGFGVFEDMCMLFV